MFAVADNVHSEVGINALWRINEIFIAQKRNYVRDNISWKSKKSLFFGHAVVIAYTLKFELITFFFLLLFWILLSWAGSPIYPV